MRQQLFHDRPGEAYGSSVSHDFVLEIAGDEVGPGHGWHTCAAFAAFLSGLAFCVASIHWIISGTPEPGGRVSVGVGTSAYVIVEFSAAIALAALSTAFSGLAIYNKRPTVGRLHVREAGRPPEEPSPPVGDAGRRPIESRTTQTWF